jgi:hypothetical protein
MTTHTKETRKSYIVCISRSGRYSADFSDVVLKFGDEEFKAHKFVVAESSVMRSLFTLPTMDAEKLCIDMSEFEVPCEVSKVIIKYLYGFQIQCETMEQVKSIIHVAYVFDLGCVVMAIIKNIMPLKIDLGLFKMVCEHNDTDALKYIASHKDVIVSFIENMEFLSVDQAHLLFKDTLLNVQEFDIIKIVEKIRLRMKSENKASASEYGTVVHNGGDFIKLYNVIAFRCVSMSNCLKCITTKKLSFLKSRAEKALVKKTEYHEKNRTAFSTVWNQCHNRSRYPKYGVIIDVQ